MFSPFNGEYNRLPEQLYKRGIAERKMKIK
jgi:hypothetical protein